MESVALSEYSETQQPVGLLLQPINEWDLNVSTWADPILSTVRIVATGKLIMKAELETGTQLLTEADLEGETGC